MHKLRKKQAVAVAARDPAAQEVDARRRSARAAGKRRSRAKKRAADVATKVATIFTRYADGECLSKSDIATFEDSDEPEEWKCVIRHSPYNGPRTLAKDNFFIDRAASTVTPETALCPDLRFIVDDHTVREGRDLFDYAFYQRLHLRCSTVVFSSGAQRHPIHFWEQIAVCHYCGAQRPSIMPPSVRCHRGTYVLNELHPVEPEQVALPSSTPMFQSSRAI